MGEEEKADTAKRAREEETDGGTARLSSLEVVYVWSLEFEPQKMNPHSRSLVLEHLSSFFVLYMFL